MQQETPLPPEYTQTTAKASLAAVKRALAPLLFALVLLAIAAYALHSHTPGKTPDILATLPAPDADAPFIVMETRDGEFPLRAAHIFADSAAAAPMGISPLAAFLPAFDAAERTAFVITERASGLSVYGALSIDRKERAALAAGKLPASWQPCFERPEVRATDRKGVLQIRAANLPGPLYLVHNAKHAYVTDSLGDMEHISESRGRGKGEMRNWTLGKEWKGRLFLSDGGVIATMSGRGSAASPTAAVTLEIAWATDGGTREEPSGRARWRMQGVENLIDGVYAKRMKKHRWDTPGDLFIPAPAIAAVGANLPPPGKNAAASPIPIRMAFDYLQKMRLKNADAQTLLTGPTTLSLAGRTQILWFDLPGVVLELHGRGKAADALVEKIWSDVFMGADRIPIEGLPSGGTTNLPFTIIAAADEKHAILGLTQPDAKRDAEIPRLLAETPSCIGWFFIDLPLLADALADLPAVSSLLQGGGDLEEGTGSHELHEELRALGRLFVTLEEVFAGRALWYY